MLIACTIIPILLIGGMSVYSIASILENKIDKGLRSNLNLVQHNLEKTLENLDYTSQQFTASGLIGQTMGKFLETSDSFEMLALRNEMQDTITLLNFTNPIVGVTLYYDMDTLEVLHTNYLTEELSFDRLPALLITRGTSYFGPHRSLYWYSDNLVFSQTRSFDNTGEFKSSGIGVYVETNFSHFQSILGPVQYGMDAFHVLLDGEGNILYSENEELFAVGTRYRALTSGGYKEFRSDGDLGFRTLLYVDQGDYQQEFRKWTFAFSIATFVSLFCGVMIAIAIRKIVYKPLLNIRKGISSVSDNKLDAAMVRSGLLEFDYIIDHFNRMRHRIVELIETAEQEEKNKRAIEVEKLMAQINPHFLYNTLNTIQWLARMKGQTEIDRFVSLFTNVLNYNLAKEGMLVTIRDELRALEDYVELQKVRYDYLFDVRIEAVEGTLEERVPRFLLQPLVENSLYHGLKDKEEGGLIQVIVSWASEGLSIRIVDNGSGMDEDEVHQLLQGTQQKAGLGIGLNYVDKTVKSYFGLDCRLNISSRRGAGTEISLILPTGGGVQNDSSVNRG